MSAFKGEEKIEMNRVATVPPTVKLGDILDQVGFGNPDYVNPSTTINLYVETPANGGDDLNDGLTKETAFATPLRALNEIPRNSSGKFIIQCGKGQFTAPVIKGGWQLADIKVYADRSTPVLTFPSGTNMVKTANTHTRFELLNAGVHSGFTDHDHWIEADTDNGALLDGYTVEESVSPDIRSVSFHTAINSIIAVHKRDTVFISPSKSSGIWGVLNSSNSFKRPKFIGIDFDFSNQTESLFPVISPSYVSLIGCRNGQYTSDPLSSDVLSCMLNEGALVSDAVKDYRGIYGCIVNQFGVIERGDDSGSLRCLFKSPNVGSFNRYQVIGGKRGFGLFIDFDVSASASGLPAVSISNGSNIFNAAGPYINGTYENAISVSKNSTLSISSPISGSTQGVCVDIKDGSSVSGLGIGHTVSNSVNPGQEVSVGSNAPTTFALSVGTNDYSSPTSEGCRGN